MMLTVCACLLFLINIEAAPAPNPQWFLPTLPPLYPDYQPPIFPPLPPIYQPPSPLHNPPSTLHNHPSTLHNHPSTIHGPMATKVVRALTKGAPTEEIMAVSGVIMALIVDATINFR